MLHPVVLKSLGSGTPLDAGDNSRGGGSSGTAISGNSRAAGPGARGDASKDTYHLQVGLTGGNPGVHTVHGQMFKTWRQKTSQRRTVSTIPAINEINTHTRSAPEPLGKHFLGCTVCSGHQRRGRWKSPPLGAHTPHTRLRVDFKRTAGRAVMSGDGQGPRVKGTNPETWEGEAGTAAETLCAALCSGD